MANAFIPYGIYWSTPFAKWQGSIAHLHSLKLAANVGKQFLQSVHRLFPCNQEFIELFISDRCQQFPNRWSGRNSQFHHIAPVNQSVRRE